MEWSMKPLMVCEILDHLRRPIARKNRRPGKYPYYGAMVFRTT